MTRQSFNDQQFITYRPYTAEHFERIPQIGKLTSLQQFETRVASLVLPFKTNNYVINELIDWSDPLHDPLFRLTFPQKELLPEAAFNALTQAIQYKVAPEITQAMAANIRTELLAGTNRPVLPPGSMAHPSPHILAFYPAEAQACHAHCTFCYRWEQFAGSAPVDFLHNPEKTLFDYLRQHSAITQLVLSGGDPMMMPTASLNQFFDQLLAPALEHVHTITIETKSLAYWPYRFTLDKDAPALLALFEKIIRAGKKLILLAHFSHPTELSTRALSMAIERILRTGTEIRTQGTVLRSINDDAATWAELWKKQLDLGCIPQSMLVTQDTGPGRYFSLPLVKVLHLFRKAVQLAVPYDLTVPGPVMEDRAGKILVLDANSESIQLCFLQAIQPAWEARPFAAVYDENARWINTLKPLSGEKFFFENELGHFYPGDL